MMVWGSVVSSRALAGAVSALNRVPVTTTVSRSGPKPSALAATCWAAAGSAPKTSRARKADEPKRRLRAIKDMSDPSNNDISQGTAAHAGRIAFYAIQSVADWLG